MGERNRLSRRVSAPDAVAEHVGLTGGELREQLARGCHAGELSCYVPPRRKLEIEVSAPDIYRRNLPPDFWGDVPRHAHIAIVALAHLTALDRLGDCRRLGGNGLRQERSPKRKECYSFHLCVGAGGKACGFCWIIC